MAGGADLRGDLLENRSELSDPQGSFYHTSNGRGAATENVVRFDRHTGCSASKWARGRHSALHEVRALRPEENACGSGAFLGSFCGCRKHLDGGSFHQLSVAVRPVTP